MGQNGFFAKNGHFGVFRKETRKLARLKLIDENYELKAMRLQIGIRSEWRKQHGLSENGSIRVDIRIPDSCKKCPFRLNDSREHWKCFLVRTIRNTLHYIPKTVEDDERADFCPFNKKG